MARTTKDIAQEYAGRMTLAGLDQTTGLIAFDAAQGGDWDDRPADAKVVIVNRNRAETREYIFHPGIPVTNSEPFWAWSWRGRFNWHGTEDEHNLKARWPDFSLPWIRLKYSKPWIDEQFRVRFGSRFVARRERRGGNQLVWVTREVFPFRPVYDWFRFLWPELDMLHDRISKYWTGFTDEYTKINPGAGAKVRIIGSPIYKGMGGQTFTIHSIESTEGYPRIDVGSPISLLSLKDFIWAVVE